MPPSLTSANEEEWHAHTSLPFPTEVVSPVETVEEPAAPPPVEAEPPPFDPQVEQQLRETLGVSSIEKTPVELAPPPADSAAVRARTLAALDDLRQIPALQSLAQEFVQKLGRPEVAVEEVVETIEKDSALCVRVLRLANSVLVASERRIEDLDTAVQMLGVKRVRQVAQALFTLRGANRVAEGFDWRHLWVHALATAAIAEELEDRLYPVAHSQIYLAALLHDVGKIVLSTLAPDDYREVLIAAWNENGRLEALERARLGVDHREAGGIFARHNELPAVVQAAISHHDDPRLEENHALEVALVALANYLSKAHGLGFSGARLDESDGDFETQPAWEVVAAQIGYEPDRENVATAMRNFIGGLRADLATVREGL